MPYFGENAAEVSCRWDGNSSIKSSTGVSSVSDLGTGRSRVNFSSSFSNSNYTAGMGGAAGNTNGSWDSWITGNQESSSNIHIMMAFPNGLTNGTGGAGSGRCSVACFPN